MAVASNQIVHTHLSVPSDAELGLADLEVVANGIPSKTRSVEIVDCCESNSKSKESQDSQSKDGWDCQDQECKKAGWSLLSPLRGNKNLEREP